MDHVIRNANGTVSHRCPVCGGASHPSTGCEYRPGYVVCWRCTREAWHFIKGWTNKKPRRGGPDFYASIPPKEGVLLGHG